MNLFTMITIIVIAALVSSLAHAWIKSRKIKSVDLSPLENRLSEVESLSERVKVLEAIVTDKGYDLKKEIDAL